MPKPMANGERQESITAIGSDGSNAAANLPKIICRRTFFDMRRRHNTLLCRRTLLTCGDVFALWTSPPFFVRTNTPPILVPPEDHSCEGRNLTVSCATIRQFAPDSPFPRKTIPAKAGISQCRVRQFADSPPIPRSPGRPFLRRQESHNVVCHNSPIRPRFPVPPEDHSCEGRNLTTVCRQRRRN